MNGNRQDHLKILEVDKKDHPLSRPGASKTTQRPLWPLLGDTLSTSRKKKNNNEPPASKYNAAKFQSQLKRRDINTTKKRTA